MSTNSKRVVQRGQGRERSIHIGIGSLDVRPPKILANVTDVAPDHKVPFISGVLPKWTNRLGNHNAILNRFRHHAVVLQIEGASYRLRMHTDFICEHTRTNSRITPPGTLRRRGRSLQNEKLIVTTG